MLPKSTFMKAVTIVACIGILGFGLCTVGYVAGNRDSSARLGDMLTPFGSLVPTCILILILMGVGRLIYNAVKR
jgi:hypothetical protein